MHNVVDDQRVSELVGLPVLHELGSPDLDNVEVGRAQKQGRQGAGHEGPVVDPGVPAVPDGFEDGAHRGDDLRGDSGNSNVDVLFPRQPLTDRC